MKKKNLLLGFLFLMLMVISSITTVNAPYRNPHKFFTVSIMPLHSELTLGQSVNFTSIISGGWKPYTSTWYVNENAISTLANWTFMPIVSGSFTVNLQVTDKKGQYAFSENAFVIVSEPQPNFITLVSNIAWFYYSDMTVRWIACRLDREFQVDLDGDHSTVASSTSIWISTYGEAADIGAMYQLDNYWWDYVWGPRIGEKKIDYPPYEWYLRLPEGGEWFGYTLNKTTQPTDYIAILHASNGESLLPITNTFWYTADGRNTWKSFTP